MSDQKKHTARISGPREYILTLTDDRELAEVVKKDRLMAAEARAKTMGDVSQALRTHLHELFNDDKRREISMLRSRELMGITGAQEQIERMFKQFSERRTPESLVMEYDYLIGMTSLISATRHAINEVSELAVEKKIGELVDILEAVIKIVSRYTKIFMGGKKLVKGTAMGEFNLLTPEASVEMIELTVTSNLKNTVRLATQLNEIVKRQRPQSSDLVVTPDDARREWFTMAIEKLIQKLKDLLAYFGKNQKQLSASATAPVEEASVEEKIIDKTLTSLKAISTQLRIILAHLEQRPGLFVFHHFELLKSFANEPEQSLGEILKGLEKNQDK